MRRRSVLGLIGAAAAPMWTQRALAQSSRILRVGLVSSTNPRSAPQYAAIDQRLAELRYIEGQNLTLEFILLHGDVERYREAMVGLVRRGALAPRGCGGFSRGRGISRRARHRRHHRGLGKDRRARRAR